MTNDEALISEDVPIACSLTVDELGRRREEIDALFSEVQQTQELVDGYALRFPGTSTCAQRVLDFIQGERACCLFFTFELVFIPNQGPLWLHIRGPAGVKAMIMDTLTSRGIALT